MGGFPEQRFVRPAGVVVEDSRTIDLRSDTVTMPSPAMRRAMAEAAVGDDFYGEDPTVRALEERGAELLGKEAGLFVPSGTMGNLIAHLVHVPGGGVVVGPAEAHSFQNEGGGPARVAGVSVKGFPQPDGRLDLERISTMIGRGSLLVPPTRLIWIEQPTRGYVVPLDDLAGLRAVADTHGVPIHFDGARIFNAAIYLGVSAASIAAYADTVMFCLSKGLAAPVGSLLVGPTSFISEARRMRQMLGGGLRQAGILAAAGLYALEHNVDRLAEDHDNARRLAGGLARLPGLRIDRAVVETNIFYVEVGHPHLSAQMVAHSLRERGVLVNVPAPGRRMIRFVTHFGIDSADIDLAIARAGELLMSANPTSLVGGLSPEERP